MTIRPVWLRTNGVAGWSFAAAAFLAALVARFAISGLLPDGFPYLTFLPAILATVYLVGLWPSVAVTVASTLAAWYFFLPPARSLALSPGSALTVLFFSATAGISIAVIHAMNRSLERLRQEEARSAALARDRETLFKELQHRISNNLGIVSALLNLQRADIKDEKARQALTEAATRLQLIAKIHRKLHDPAGAQLRFGPFLEELCHDVLEASGARNIVCLVSAAAGVEIAADRTIPLALIVTELISNALEHGFSGDRPGTIRIDLSTPEPGSREQVLTVADDGTGLPQGFALDNATGLGLRIVQALARQLDGRFAMETAGGTTCRLVFSA